MNELYEKNLTTSKNYGIIQENVRKENFMEYDDILCVDVVSYGLYEDLYKECTFSVEQAYEEYWNEKNGEM